MKRIENYDDLIKFFAYIESIGLTVPTGTVISVNVTSDVYDHIARQLRNRNHTYVDLTNYTEMTISNGMYKVQLKIIGFYANQVTKLNNLMK